MDQEQQTLEYKEFYQLEHGVTVIDKINYKIDGHIWYRVKLQDGTQGYISEAYIQKAPMEKYRIEEGNVK